jgi:hypothetical protein
MEQLGRLATEENQNCQRYSYSSRNTNGNSTVTRVPVPIVLRMLHFPPNNRTRCRMPSKPKRFS